MDSVIMIRSPLLHKIPQSRDFRLQLVKQGPGTIQTRLPAHLLETQRDGANTLSLQIRCRALDAVRRMLQSSDIPRTNPLPQNLHLTRYLPEEFIQKLVQKLPIPLNPLKRAWDGYWTPLLRSHGSLLLLAFPFAPLSTYR